MNIFTRLLNWFRPKPKLSPAEAQKVLTAAYRQMVDDCSGMPDMTRGARSLAAEVRKAQVDAAMKLLRESKPNISDSELAEAKADFESAWDGDEPGFVPMSYDDKTPCAETEIGDCPVPPLGFFEDKKDDQQT